MQLIDEETNQVYLEENEKKRVKIKVEYFFNKISNDINLRVFTWLKALEEWFAKNLDIKTKQIDDEINKGLCSISFRDKVLFK